MKSESLTHHHHLALRTVMGGILPLLAATLLPAADLPVLEFPEIPEWINVRTEVEPKAVGDGIADDTAALQAALNRVDGGGSKTKTIYLPKGTYRITRTLSTPANVGMQILGHGSATRIVWDGRIDGEVAVPSPLAVSSLLANPSFPDNPQEQRVLSEGFTVPTGLGNSYGVRVRGWIQAPADGDYAFAVTGDDNVQVMLSTDDSMEKCTSIIDWRDYSGPDEWHKHPSQRTAAPVRLSKGHRYAVELRFKQGAGPDYATLAWTVPGGPADRMIPAEVLFQGAAADAAPGLHYERYADATTVDLPVMCWSNGALSAIWEGLVWDGAGKAKVGFLHAARDRFECNIQHRRVAYINCREDGMRMGPQSPFATSESEFTDCVFAGNGRAGAAIVDFNYYNEIFTRCHFRDNAFGVWADRYGQAFVYDCTFERSSKSDLRLSEAHRHAVRGSTSSGSRRFIEGNSFTAAICRIDSWSGTDGAISVVGNHGPILLHDLTFGSGPGPAVATTNSGLPLLLSRVTTKDGPVTVAGDPKRLSQLADGEVVAAAPVAGPAPAPPVWGKVINVADFDVRHGENEGKNSEGFQRAVDAAIKAGPGAVLWLPSGLRPYLNKTVVIDRGAFSFRGSGYHSDLQWSGPAGQAMFEIRDPQGLVVQDVAIVSHAGGVMLGMQQTSTGMPSRCTYRNIYVSDNWRAEEGKAVRGLELKGLGKDSWVSIERITGGLGVVDCAAATIIGGFFNGTPLLVENPSGGPRGGFLGIRHANNGGIIVRDNLELVMTDSYCEQGNNGFLLATGRPEHPAGRITISSARLHLWKAAPFFIKAAGYQGQITVSNADVTLDNSPESYVTLQEGNGVLDALLMGHNRPHFSWKLTTGRKLLLGIRDLDDVEPTAAKEAAVKAIDHWRELHNAR